MFPCCSRWRGRGGQCGMVLGVEYPEEKLDRPHVSLPCLNTPGGWGVTEEQRHEKQTLYSLLPPAPPPLIPPGHYEHSLSPPTGCPGQCRSLQTSYWFFIPEMCVNSERPSVTETGYLHSQEQLVLTLWQERFLSLCWMVGEDGSAPCIGFLQVLESEGLLFPLFLAILYLALLFSSP